MVLQLKNLFIISAIIMALTLGHVFMCIIQFLQYPKDKATVSIWHEEIGLNQLLTV